MTSPTDDPGPPRERLNTVIETADRAWTRAGRFVETRLVWGRVYQTTSYLRSALWTVPLVAIVLVLVIAPLLRDLDSRFGWRLAGFGVSGATALYQTVVTLTLSFLVFTFGSLLVAIQVASGQLTPRIIATALLRDNVVRFSVGLFVFSLVFAVMALNRLEEHVFELISVVTAGLGIACIATFLFLIDYAARLLRPVSILARIGDEGFAVINAVYPNQASDMGDDPRPATSLPAGPRRIVTHTGISAIVLAVDLQTLVRSAKRVDGVVECVPHVGDFVATDEPLFVLYGGAVKLGDEKLRATVAFGSERTMEQDPLFSLRIMADIALKALSPAINDPTTAVLALDQIHRLLRVVGKRRLHGELIVDDQGRDRVLLKTPNWEDFVHLACSEIRACGASNVQIARRMRAMLDNLLATLPSHRHPALTQELGRLDRALESLYPIPDDLALARIPDSQGLGPSGSRERPVR